MTVFKTSARLALIPLLFGFSFAACAEEPHFSSDDDDEGSTGAFVTTSTAQGGGSSSGSTGGNSSVPGGPTIGALTWSETSLEFDGSNRLTAQVDDPDGASDVVGGDVTLEDGTVVATFLKSGGGTTHVAEVTWSSISTLVALRFPNGGADLPLRVVFRDQRGLEASAALNLPLSCSEVMGYCGGPSCANTDFDPDHCGACDNACALCNAGKCEATPSEACITTSPIDCSFYCLISSLACSEQCPFGGMAAYPTTDCSGPPATTGNCPDSIPAGTGSYRCCCE